MKASELRELAAKATPGCLIHHGWGDGSTEMGMTNIFNEDAEVLLMECIPEADAALIVALRNNLPAILSALEAVEGMREALEPFAFLEMGKDEDEGAAFTTQEVWETIYSDRVQDWFDYADLDRARQALALKEKDGE